MKLSLPATADCSAPAINGRRWAMAMSRTPVEVTFLGHSTVLIELAGRRILTDPVLFDRVWFLGRVRAPIEPELTRDIDLALVSHLHLDHFDRRSLALLGSGVRLVVPKGAGALLRSMGFERVEELKPSESSDGDGVAIRATHAAHGGFRPPFGPAADAVGFLIEAGGARIYFAGDTDLFPAMADLAPGLDLAFVPVWGWGPRLGPGHLDPRRAAAAVRLLQPRFAVPIHWGTFWTKGLLRMGRGRLTEPPLEFAELVAESAPGTTVIVLAPGDRIDLEL